MLNMPQGIAQSDISMDDALLAAGYTEQKITNDNETRSTNTRGPDAGTQVDQGTTEIAASSGAQSDRGRESPPGQDTRSGSPQQGLTQQPIAMRHVWRNPNSKPG